MAKETVDEFGAFQKKTSDAEQEKCIEQWVEERNSHIGEIKIPQIGEYPPRMDNFYGSQMNEWVTTDLIRHYADALGDRNPLWRNQEYARGTRWGGIIAPPTFLSSIIQHAPIEFDPENFRKFNSFYMYPNGEKYQLLRVIRPGDKLRVVQKFLGVKEVPARQPKPCHQFDSVVQRTIFNQRDEVVAISQCHDDVAINLLMDAEHPYYAPRKKRRLTDEERDAIYRGYDQETRRGADTLFWEDVAVGEDIKLHSVGPLSVYDMAAWYTAEAGHAVGFELEWERVKLVPGFHWLDPEVNAWTCAGTGHFCEGKGHVHPNAFGFRSQLEGLMSRMLCNWMGDDGFLKMLYAPVKNAIYLGEVLNPKGKVTKKYTSDGEYLVDLDVCVENMDGVLLQSGSATVRLLSRVEP